MTAESLMSRFLSFARPLHLNPEMLDLSKLIESALSGFMQSCPERITLSKLIGENLPMVKGDPALLRQALLNLLINASDELPDGGEIRIRCGRSDKGQSDELFISIADNGPGIDPEIQARIFEPFVTGKPNGTGLGLALVKKIVVMHGGRIEVQSKPGKGARFVIILRFEKETVDSQKEESVFSPAI
jgi:signal transduction histidine kinase